MSALRTMPPDRPSKRAIVLNIIVILLTPATAPPVLAGWTSAIAPGDAYSVVLDDNGDVIVAGEQDGDFAWAAMSGEDGSILWECKSARCEPPMRLRSGFGRARRVVLDHRGRVVVAGYEEPIGEVWESELLVLRQTGPAVDDYSGWRVREVVPGGRSEANDVAVLPDDRVVVAGFATVGAPAPEHTEIHLSVIDVDGVEVASRRLTGDHVAGDASAQAVAALADGSVIVAGTVWEAERDDKFYVNRVRASSGMPEVWANPYFAGSPVSADVAHDVAVGPETVVAAGQRTGKFTVVRFGENSGLPLYDFPYQDEAGAAYAVVVDSRGDIVAAGERSNGDLLLVKLGGRGRVLWSKTVSGARCEKDRCDVAVDEAGNVIAVGSKDGRIFSRKWTSAGRAAGGEILSASGTTARAVDAVASLTYVVASDGGLRATEHGCALVPAGRGRLAAHPALLLAAAAALWLRRRAARQAPCRYPARTIRRLAATRHVSVGALVPRGRASGATSGAGVPPARGISAGRIAGPRRACPPLSFAGLFGIRVFDHFAEFDHSPV